MTETITINYHSAMSIETGHTLEEWTSKYGTDSQCYWDFPMEDFITGAVEVNEDIVYWLIDGRIYETDIEPDRESFRCVIGSRADFEERGYDTSHLSNKEMERIFEKIGEILVGYGGYWEAIDEWGSDMPHNENFSNED